MSASPFTRKVYSRAEVGPLRTSRVVLACAGESVAMSGSWTRDEGGHMRASGRAAVVVVTTVVVIVGATVMRASHHGDGSNPPATCDAATIRGEYGAQIQGTRPAPGGSETVVGIVLRTYDGEGGFTQVSNVKGSVNGWVPDQPGAGTYEVSADCSGTIRFEPMPGVVIEERIGDRRWRTRDPHGGDEPDAGRHLWRAAADRQALSGGRGAALAQGGTPTQPRRRDAQPHSGLEGRGC